MFKWLKRESPVVEYRTELSPNGRYYTYKLCDCGAVLIKNDGPMGNGNFINVDDMTQDWAKADFLGAYNRDLHRGEGI